MIPTILFAVWQKFINMFQQDKYPHNNNPCEQQLSIIPIQLDSRELWPRNRFRVCAPWPWPLRYQLGTDHDTPLSTIIVRNIIQIQHGSEEFFFVIHQNFRSLKIRATDKARKSVITHWKWLKTHWKYKLAVKICISILRYALGVQCSACWLLIHV